MSAPTHYEVLGLSPAASLELIERAYRFHLELYRENSLATYSLLAPDESRALRSRVQEAYEVLHDPERRHAYDVVLGLVPTGSTSADLGGEAPVQAEPGVAVPPSAPGPVPEAPPPPPVLPDPVTGRSLRAYREWKGVSLRDIANQSKIGVRFLEYIEADRFRDLPAPVYIRGFLREYARACGLDPARTADSYVSRFWKP